MNLFDALIMLIEIVTGRTIIKLARKDKLVQTYSNYECQLSPDIQTVINSLNKSMISNPYQQYSIYRQYLSLTDDELIDYHETKRIFKLYGMEDENV